MFELTYDSNCSQNSDPCTTNGFVFKDLSVELNFEYQEHVSHTLWDPLCLISANGGIAPLTFNSFVVRFSLYCLHFSFLNVPNQSLFQRVASSIQEPSRPVPNIDWGLVNFFKPPVECPIKSPHFTVMIWSFQTLLFDKHLINLANQYNDRGKSVQ